MDAPVIGAWYASTSLRSNVRLVDVQKLWGGVSCTVWVPTADRVTVLPGADLQPLETADALSPEGIVYRAAAARVLDALAQDLPLAPVEATVIPLPHQIYALQRAISSDRVRFLLADEVGLGKTIEAGLILRELKLRGLVRRTLVVTPRGLVGQWVAELKTHFQEDFRLVNPADLSVLRSLASDRNPWSLMDQVVTSMDAVKPVDSRRGWSKEQLAEHNRDRYESLLSAEWDLVIIDEAHRLGGSNDQVARFRLGQGLSDSAPYLLLLSATPHQGKTDAFRRILSLLDTDSFPDDLSIKPESVQPYVIRTEKRQAIDVEGHPLFQPRTTRLVAVEWASSNSGYKLQEQLYEAVSDYVREGYNRALREKRNYIGFLMVLMQRLVTSSTAAIRSTLERRQVTLGAIGESSPQLSLFADDWSELDGQEQADLLATTPFVLMRNERAEVLTILDLARRCDAAGPDAKASALLDLIYDLRRDANEPELKVLIFTEFLPTQEMLRRFLGERGFSVVTLNGSMDLDERQAVQTEFANDAQIMVSTDAGGEGLNLQFCHVVVNFDMPWNPMRLEQRIGRVDRIGQSRPVLAYNLILADTVEFRVREVLEAKLTVIQNEFGVDKTGDVLDSAEAEGIFDNLYVRSVLQPDSMEQSVASALAELRTQVEAAQSMRGVLGSATELNADDAKRVASHPLPAWVETMTVNAIRAEGGRAERRQSGWLLEWPGESSPSHVAFQPQNNPAATAPHLLSLEDPRVRGLVDHLPAWAPGQPIPVIRIDNLPAGITGTWSLWRVGLHVGDWQRTRVFPVFVHDDGRTLLPTARRVWDELLSRSPQVQATLRGGDAVLRMNTARAEAERLGEHQVSSLRQSAQAHHGRLQAKADFAFSARRRVLERIGLPEVRSYRLANLAREEDAWRANVVGLDMEVAELQPLLVVYVSEDAQS